MRSERKVRCTAVTALCLLGVGLTGATQAQAAHPRPSALATADLNGDGRPDLAVADAGTHTVWIFLNTPSGLPGTPDHTLAGTRANPLRSPQAIAAGDFNDDGWVDLAVTNHRGRSVSIFLGNGDGTFAGPTNYTVRSSPRGIATGQFHKNTTQNLDLVVVDSGKLQVLTGHGDGTFTAGAPIGPIGRLPQQVAVGDFLKPGSQPPALDGYDDVAVTLKGEDRVAVLWGDGDGNLTGLVKYASDRGGRGIVAAHLSSTTYLDLATANHRGSGVNTIALLPANPTSGGFANAMAIAQDLSYPNLLVAGNFSGRADGKMDLAVTDTGGSGTTHDKLVVLRNDIAPPSYAFTQVAACDAGDGPSSVVTADFNGDGVPDFAVGNSVSDDVSIITGSVVGGVYHCSTPTQIGE